jgi:hypothetical protein
MIHQCHAKVFAMLISVKADGFPEVDQRKVGTNQRID